jgi:predicted nuclease with TOPRIM domain
MAKIPDIDAEQLKDLLVQINDRISSAKVLNGGFDRLEKEVSEIKKMQSEMKSEMASSQTNQERMENKLDRLYDPEAGIYSKVQKAEIMLVDLNQKMSKLTTEDQILQTKIEKIEEKAEIATLDLEKLKKVTGENHEDLSKSIKISKGFIWFSGITLAGFLSALGKFLWDLFSGQ